MYARRTTCRRVIVAYTKAAKKELEICEYLSDCAAEWCGRVCVCGDVRSLCGEVRIPGPAPHDPATHALARGTHLMHISERLRPHPGDGH